MTIKNSQNGHATRLEPAKLRAHFARGFRSESLGL